MATETRVETRIEEAAVYVDRARVTRRGRVRLAAGLHELIVEDLPETLLPDSARAAARAAVPARLLGADVRRTFHAEPPEQPVAELQARVEELEAEDEALRQRHEALVVRRGFLHTLASSAGEQLARGIALGRSPVEAGAAIGTFVGDQLAVIDAEALAVARERRELAKRLAAERSQLESLRRERPTERRRIVVLVELEAEGETELEVSYQVTGASWQPLYDLRVREAEGARLSLGYLAEVTQRTGEAWEGVALTLSTARRWPPSCRSFSPGICTHPSPCMAPQVRSAGRRGGAQQRMTMRIWRRQLRPGRLPRRWRPQRPWP